MMTLLLFSWLILRAVFPSLYVVILKRGRDHSQLPFQRASPSHLSESEATAATLHAASEVHLQHGLDALTVTLSWRGPDHGLHLHTCSFTHSASKVHLQHGLDVRPPSVGLQPACGIQKQLREGGGRPCKQAHSSLGAERQKTTFKLDVFQECETTLKSVPLITHHRNSVWAVLRPLRMSFGQRLGPTAK